MGPRGIPTAVKRFSHRMAEGLRQRKEQMPPKCGHVKVYATYLLSQRNEASQ